MPAIALTIFKIRSHSDFIKKNSSNKDKQILSFRKGQPFYALSTDYDRGLYFVSTQFAVPFSRTAVNGFVPMEYFEKVDLLSKDPKIQRKKIPGKESGKVRNKDKKADHVLEAPPAASKAAKTPHPTRKGKPKAEQQVPKTPISASSTLVPSATPQKKMVPFDIENVNVSELISNIQTTSQEKGEKAIILKTVNLTTRIIKI